MVNARDGYPYMTALPSDVMVGERVIDLGDEYPIKASFPSDVMVCRRSIETRDRKHEKALPPIIDVMFIRIVSSVICSFLNRLFCICRCSIFFCCSEI